ncbi:hypothetical protein H7F15_12175 [Pontibacter sp. Tf4]|uniref:hypothetical protein n=1 Tax=Pontibacter sp. Tf4 TaxID=2761620 RepID=UPI001629CA74|nr:hypothetical protein [Pontibacter sp. Tf4]MBB6611799.1 hypothetical protein [Pontibacter sp. Tf4]
MKKYMIIGAMAAIASAAAAFTGAPLSSEASTIVQYQFGGSSMSEVYELDEWTEVTGTLPSCSGSNLPCVVTVQSGTLEEWLAERDHARILKDATSKKN